MARRLDGPVLDLACYLGREVAHGHVVVREVGVMSRVRLNANTPALLGHSKDERPAVLRVQVCVREHQKALIVAEFDILLEVVKDLASMELFDPRVGSHSSRHYLLLLEHGQAGLDVAHFGQILFYVARVGSPDLESVHSTEKYLEYGLHIVDKHLLEVALLSLQLGIVLFFPHFKDDTLVDVPVAHMAFKIL